MCLIVPYHAPSPEAKQRGSDIAFPNDSRPHGSWKAGKRYKQPFKGEFKLVGPHKDPPQNHFGLPEPPKAQNAEHTKFHI